MISTTTGDAEAIRRLKDTLKRHRGDAGAWTLLGGQLRARRGTLDPRYRNRTLFVKERGEPRGLTYKFIYDLETRPKDGRAGFSIDKLLDVAAAYAVTVGSIDAALDGGALVPAPAGPAPRVPAGLPPGPAGARRRGILSDAAIVAGEPYATAILTRLRDFSPGTQPTGPEVFLDEDAPRIPGLDWDRAAGLWDDYVKVMPEDDLVWLIAAIQADIDNPAQPDSNVG